MQGGILGDASIVDEDLDRAEIGLHPLQPLAACLEARHVPLVDGDTGLILEAGGRLVVAGLGRRDPTPLRRQRFSDRGTAPPPSPAYNSP